MQAYNYENLHIGNFLVSIGYYLREIGEKCLVSLNLYQQTPNNDSTIGDLFGNLKGLYFIIEFKSNKNNIKIELKKPQRKKLIYQLKTNFRNLIKTSINGHLICYPDQLVDCLEFHLKPYLILEDNEKFEQYNIIGIKEFVNKIKDGHVGCNFEEIRMYIELLKQCSENENYSTSGIIINYDKTDGFKYVPFDNLDFLDRKLKIEMNISQDIDIKQDQTQSNKFGMGM